MFYKCSSLTSLDLSSFNTSNVVDMSSMFYNCTSLITLNLSSFDTSKVVNMTTMFYCLGYNIPTVLDLTGSTYENTGYLFLYSKIKFINIKDSKIEKDDSIIWQLDTIFTSVYLCLNDAKVMSILDVIQCLIFIIL